MNAPDYLSTEWVTPVFLTKETKKKDVGHKKGRGTEAPLQRPNLQNKILVVRQPPHGGINSSIKRSAKAT
jgi:hypothetical protein